VKKHIGVISKTPPIIIGIIPVKNTFEGMCMQLATATANYLTGLKKKNVIVINKADTDLFSNLAWYHNISFSPEDDFFELHDVRYYFHYNAETIAKACADYVILIEKASFMSAALTADDTGLKLIAGSLAPWELKSYAGFLKRMAHLYSAKTNWLFFAGYFSVRAKKQLEKDFKISIRGLPHDLDPFKLKRSDLPFFDEIFS